MNVGDEVKVHVPEGKFLLDGGQGFVEQITTFIVIRDMVGKKYKWPINEVILERVSESVHASNMKHGGRG